MTVVVASADLTAALKKVVLNLEDDLRVRVESQPDVLAAWRNEHEAAVGRERTAMSWQAWRDDRVTQAAVAWVLTTVFIRFCEDNRLLRPVWIAGPADRRQEALDAELAYFRANPEHTDREWLLQAIEYLRTTKATQDLVEPHSPLWTVSPSGQAVKALLTFWRERTAAGEVVWDLTDPELSTRLLGDLYQDLSDYAKKTYALLQTPEFVEEFILDQTMEPALAERPLEGFTLIDPTCGSGHFLLGAFKRLNDRWAAHAPGLEVQVRAQQALDAVHGVDLNPFAVATARFRLLVAAMRSCGLTTLESTPAFELHLAVGDALLHGSTQAALDLRGVADLDSKLSGFTYATEDLVVLRNLLVPGKYDVVVGNPPYAAVKDRNLNAAYRDRYPTCKGKYALTVPFMERFFDLARTKDGARSAGWTGQITSNSFMKREFGSSLIEEFLTRQDLRLVIDTSGAYIPGHGTPTVIIVGRHQSPIGQSVRAVLGIRGEPGQPDDPAVGLVWGSIVENIGSANFENAYVSVVDLPRAALATHPWSLSGAGAVDLLTHLEAGARRLSAITDSVGITAFTLEDDVYLAPGYAFHTRGVMDQNLRKMVLGDGVRDYAIGNSPWSAWPYDSDFCAIDIPRHGALALRLWPFRTNLSNSLMFGGKTKIDSGLKWTEYGRLTSTKLKTPLSITFAFVATHNHFALDRGGKVFNRSAPVIKLPEGATEDDHLALLGVLNSSTACFWLKQNSHGKGNGGVNEGFRGDDWEEFYEFTGTTLKNFPLPEQLPISLARAIDRAAQEDSVVFEAITDTTPTAGILDHSRAERERILGQMTALQEELDWSLYRSYGFLDDELTTADGEPPKLALGERAFEIALARKVEAGEASTAWFARHGSTPVNEIPARWPQPYRDLVQRRLDVIESNKFINLLERPEYKRRWATEPWEKRVEKALRGWLLDRLEDRHYWFDAQGRPAARSVAQLADAVTRDAGIVSVLELWLGRRDQSVTQQLAALLENESVPFLASHRLKDSGLRKREAWEHTWDLQRQEDAGKDVGTIPVPPKYTSADFRKASWWQHRGKLDVPKERFIAYPDAGRETDSTQLLGWAGWDHAQQALALAAVIAERESEGWTDEQLVPLVAGLAELQPWVRQWHDTTDDTYGLNLADYLEEELRGRAHQVGRTIDELKAWRPQPRTRGRRTKEKA